MLFSSPSKPKRSKAYPCVCLIKRIALFGQDASRGSTLSKPGTNYYAKSKPMRRHRVQMIHLPILGTYWKLWVPNKVKIFLWCACTEALPTKLILQKWKVLDNPSCSLYQLASQNTLDDLWSYAHLHLVWDIAFFGV